MNAVILRRTRDVPTAEQVSEILRQNGYEPFVETEKGLSTKAIMIIGQSEAEITKIYYASDKMPIIIDFDCDLWDSLAEAATQMGLDQMEIQGFTFVDAMENGDAKAFRIIVDYIRDSTNGTEDCCEYPEHP